MGQALQLYTKQVSQLSNTRVLCIGDAMLDTFIYGKVNRISPEAPIPVLRVESEMSMLGGVGNVVRNLRAIDAKAGLVSLVGEDEPGRQLKKICSEDGGIQAHLLTETARPTTLKTRFIAAHQQVLRADNENDGHIDADLEAGILKATRSALDSYDIVILSDYAKGVLTPRLTQDLIKLCRDADKKVIVDPKGADFSKYAGASMVKPNRKELGEAANMAVTTNGDVVKAAQSLMEAHDIESFLVTLSQDGMIHVNRDGDVIHHATKALEVFDVSGAGDTVIGMVAASLAAGLEMEDAMRLANAAASVVVSKVGTAVAHPSEILEVLGRQGKNGRSKIMDIKAAADRVETWRKHGLDVGFTNGVFDLLHPGHIATIARAKSECDRLVLGLNSDASVKRLKGPARPVQDEAARAAVLAGLSDVDLVVIFEEDTPIALLEALRPDVLVKGGDYTIDQVVGADLVMGYGGRVVVSKLEDGHSTTNTISKMAS